VDTLLNKLKFFHKMSADITEFVLAVSNWFVRWECFSITDFYNGSYEEDVKLIFW